MFTHFGSVVLYCFVIIIGPKHSTNYNMELYKHLTLGFLIAIFIPCTVMCTSSELRRGFKRFLERLWAFCKTPSGQEVEAEVAIISISAFIDGKAAGARNRYQKSASQMWNLQKQAYDCAQILSKMALKDTERYFGDSQHFTALQ